MSRSSAAITLGALSIASVLTAGAIPAKAVTVAQHPLPGAAGPAMAIAAAGGGLAITRAEHQSATVLERIAVAPAYSAGPVQPLSALTLTTGPDGELWLLAITSAAGAVALERAPAAGALEGRFAFPRALGSSFFPGQLAAGPDGSLWIANMTGEAVERVSPAGSLAAYALPRPGAPTSVAVAPDGSAWFTEVVTGTVGELTPGGSVVEHPVDGAPPTGFGNAEPYSIVLGPDGALWFTEQNAGRIGRITTAGELEEFPIPDTAGVQPGEYGSPAPRYITVGPDGALWFTDGGDDSIGRITTAGQISEYPIGTPTPASPQGIVSQGGRLWFAEAGLTALGSVDPNGVPAPPPRPAPAHARSRRRRCRSGRASGGSGRRRGSRAKCSAGSRHRQARPRS